MKLRYWTVRAVPSANSITTIGIGVIVEDMAPRFIRWGDRRKV